MPAPPRPASRHRQRSRNAARRSPIPRRQAAAAYLAGIDDAVQPQLRGAVSLDGFMARAGKLTLAERRRIVEQAILLLDQFYAHLPMKRAMHGIDPLRRLELLKLRLAELPSDIAFHHEMSEIFMSLRDLHTNYLLPRPYSRAVAFLPFQIESCLLRGRRRYVVSRLLPGFRHPGFRPGVEVLQWNWMPIERLVYLIGAINGASNEAARHARGLARLTVRPMIRSLPPEEHAAAILYRTPRGAVREIRLPWLVFTPRRPASPIDHDRPNPLATALGFDLDAEVIRHTKKLLYVPRVAAAEERLRAARHPHRAVSGFESTMPAIFEARPVRAPHGRFGYIRIRSFLSDDPDAFLAEFMRLVAMLPRRGLIIDVRDNGGGVLTSGEQLLQLLTPRRIEPERLQLRSTPLALALCQLDRGGELARWTPSLALASQSGALYSAGFPLTTPEACNAIGQRYHGPVVLVTNGLCYSTTDSFIAGFRDHRIGTILGTDDNTGAGGANVWTHALLRRIVGRRAGRRSALAAALEPLPKGAGMRVALRRTLRVGAQAGTELEELGIVPDAVHAMTLDDLLHRNRDLIAHAAAILAAKPAYRLDAEAAAARGGGLRVVARTENISRLDLMLDGRPFGSATVPPRGGRLAFEIRPRATEVSLQGYRNGKLVAARKLKLEAPPLRRGSRSAG
jgi:hypothetical protein